MMRAVVAHGPGDLRVEEQPAPRAGRGRVVVRIVYGGICGSDLHYAADGRNGAYIVAEPLTLGHEVVGILDHVGPDTQGAPPVGTPVAIHPATPTPPPGGAVGRGLHLTPGGTYLGSASTRPHTQGGFVDHLELDPAQLRPLPDGLPLRRAVLAEPLAVALHGIGRLGDRVRGARALVSGSGPIGVLATAALRAAGAAHVTATDLQEHPLRVAREVGADETVVLGAGRQVEPRAYDVVVEAAGAIPSLATSLDAVRPGGAVLQLGMLPAGPLPVPMAALIAKEVALLGSQRFDVELDAAVAMLAADPALAAVVTQVFDAPDALAAFECAADSARSTKVTLYFGGDPERA